MQCSCPVLLYNTAKGVQPLFDAEAEDARRVAGELGLRQHRRPAAECYVANFLFGLFDDYGESLRDLDAANAKAPHASKMSMPAAPHASRCRCN